jgi:hypothetical protein
MESSTQNIKDKSRITRTIEFLSCAKEVASPFVFLAAFALPGFLAGAISGASSPSLAHFLMAGAFFGGAECAGVIIGGILNQERGGWKAGVFLLAENVVAALIGGYCGVPLGMAVVAGVSAVSPGAAAVLKDAGASFIDFWTSNNTTASSNTCSPSVIFFPLPTSTVEAKAHEALAAPLRSLKACFSTCLPTFDRA